MANSSMTYSQLPKDSEVWDSLKEAIAASSGFQRWQQEQSDRLQGLEVDQLVRAYLRDTLETLAY